MAVWIAIIVASLIFSLGYRAWKYKRIRSQGYDVRWSAPIARWIRRLFR